MLTSPRSMALSLAVTLLVVTPATSKSDAGERAADPSAGCGTVGADAMASAQLSVADEVRELEVHVPTAHDGISPLPLIIWLHGQGMGIPQLLLAA